MTGREVLADVLLGLAVAIVLASSIGLLVMRDVYQKLHFVTPIALVAPLIVGSRCWRNPGSTRTPARPGWRWSSS